MRIALVYNSISGAGRGARLAGAFDAALSGAGHAVTRYPTHDAEGRPGPGLDAMRLQAEGVGLIVVIGGDGTVHRVAPVAAASGAAMYHVPAGTENLFARGYGMTRDPAKLVRAIERERFRPMDLGECAGSPFVLMASMGPDAGVIHRLHQRRRGPIRQWSYVRPIIAEVVAPRLPLVTVRVDGRVAAARVRGLVVVGNSPQYAWRLNPARTALADDGALDVVVFPCDTVADTMVWAAKLMKAGLMTGGGEAPRGVIWARGAAIEITPHDRDGVMQMDGEVGMTGEQAAKLGRVVFGVRKHAFRVLEG